VQLRRRIDEERSKEAHREFGDPETLSRELRRDLATKTENLEDRQLE
jgi:hypothetical protein